MSKLFHRLARIGSGVGVEIRGADLRLVAVKVRGGATTALGARTIAGFRGRPPAEWGGEYREFLTETGLNHAAATVCLPREEVIVRQIALPPMPAKERAAAVGFQLDSLHPFGDDEVVWGWTALDDSGRAGAPTPTAVVVTERARAEAYAEMFEQAEIAVSAFTVSAAALHAALRARWATPPKPLLLALFDGPRMEVYGESAGRPLLTAEFDLRSIGAERALDLAAADLRLGPEGRAAFAFAGEGGDEPPPEIAGLEWKSPSELFPAPAVAAPVDFDARRDLRALAAAIENACPRLGWRANLLPAERRRTDSRWRYAPTAALAASIALLAAGFVVRPIVQDRAYAAALEERIAQFETVGAATEAAAGEAERVRRKLEVLRDLSLRTELDLRILSEVSERLPASAWLRQIEIDDAGARLAGEAREAAPLLEELNRSSVLEGAAFAGSLQRIDAGEAFAIVAKRRAAPASPPAEAPAPPAEAPVSSEPASAGGALRPLGGGAN